jgi:hypothetical protein
MANWQDIIRINKKVRKAGIKTYIETGTGACGSLKDAIVFPFKKIYTIDAFEPATNDAKELFGHMPHIKFICGYSQDILQEILPLMDEKPIFFWLDAHFPGNFGFKLGRFYEPNLSRRCPLQAELELIFKAREKYGYPDIIACDDFKIYNPKRIIGGTGSLKYADIYNVIPKELHSIRVAKGDDILLIYKKGLYDTK